MKSCMKGHEQVIYHSTDPQCPVCVVIEAKARVEDELTVVLREYADLRRDFDEALAGQKGNVA